jgi:hypothetical protein
LMPRPTYGWSILPRLSIIAILTAVVGDSRCFIVLYASPLSFFFFLLIGSKKAQNAQ